MSEPRVELGDILINHAEAPHVILSNIIHFHGNFVNSWQRKKDICIKYGFCEKVTQIQQMATGIPVALLRRSFLQSSSVSSSFYFFVFSEIGLSVFVLNL
ncbi:hypothetical protein [Paenibacillus sp. OV219]|uniref:hypothetical protein n=1 Tax=Paenibacillus sp. OV219 TaxID=1884377 RepID=UPI001160DE09|nr:hypothetical protein [Paenibacillus sp. OV219]